MKQISILRSHSKFHHIWNEYISNWGIHSPLTKLPHHSMHNRNILILNLIHHDFSNVQRRLRIPEEEEISALESGLHGATEDDYYRTGGVGEDRETFPHL